MNDQNDQILEEETVPEETPEEKKPVNRKKVGLLVVLGIVIAALLAVAIAFAVKHSNENVVPSESQAVTGETRPVQNYENYTGTDITEKQLQTVMAEMDGETVNNATFSICYWMTYYDFLRMSGQNIMFMGLDPQKPLEAQSYPTSDGTTMTWQQFFIEQALVSWSRYQALGLEAAAHGVTLTPELQETLDNMEAEMTASAQQYGFESPEAMLQSDFGAGVTLQDYQEFLALMMVGDLYYQQFVDGMEITEDQISAYYDDHAEGFTAQNILKDETPATMDVRHILIAPEGEPDENGKYTEEQMAAATEKAQAILDQYLAGEKTAEAFGELAKANSVDGSAPQGGLYEKVTPGMMVPEFNDWCFDPARKIGDTGIVQSPYGAHVMYFVNSSEETYWHANAKAQLYNETVADWLDAQVEAHPYEVHYENIVLTPVDHSQPAQQ